MSVSLPTAVCRFGLPPSLTAVVPRIKNNLQYFLSNYMCVFIVLMVSFPVFID